jgi:hypothetical protein
MLTESAAIVRYDLSNRACAMHLSPASMASNPATHVQNLFVSCSSESVTWWRVTILQARRPELNAVWKNIKIFASALFCRLCEKFLFRNIFLCYLHARAVSRGKR